MHKILTCVHMSIIFTVLLRWKRCCIGLNLFLIIVLLLVFVVFILYARAPVLHHTQPIYGPQDVVYSPFSDINQFLFNRIKATIRVDQTEDLSHYSLTICQATCPLKIQTKHLVSSGACLKSRYVANCYAKLNEELDHYSGTDAQYFSEYMLKNSSITFRITATNIAPEPVQLCITTDKDSCYQVFRSQPVVHQVCQQLLTLNETNHYMQTFTVGGNSYYCAVWRLGNSDQWINYTTNSSLYIYNATDFYSPRWCETFQNHAQVTFTLRGRPSLAPNTCIIMQENSKKLYNNVTIVTTTIKPLGNVASIALGVFAGLFILISCVILTICCLVCVVHRLSVTCA